MSVQPALATSLVCADTPTQLATSYEFFLLLVALYLMFGWAVFVLADGSESSFDVEATSYSDLYQVSKPAAVAVGIMWS